MVPDGPVRDLVFSSESGIIATLTPNCVPLIGSTSLVTSRGKSTEVASRNRSLNPTGTQPAAEKPGCGGQSPDTSATIVTLRLHVRPANERHAPGTGNFDDRDWEDEENLRDAHHDQCRTTSRSSSAWPLAWQCKKVEAAVPQQACCCCPRPQHAAR